MKRRQVLLICEQCFALYTNKYCLRNTSRFCDTHCRAKWIYLNYRETYNQTGKLAGERNPNWKGGITPEHLAIRTSTEYKLWRKAIFQRDNWTCQECGKHGGWLEAHHIKPFAQFPELRLAINNGITLCKPCHKTQTYAKDISSYAIDKA